MEQHKGKNDLFNTLHLMLNMPSGCIYYCLFLSFIALGLHLIALFFIKNWVHRGRLLLRFQQCCF